MRTSVGDVRGGAWADSRHEREYSTCVLAQLVVKMSFLVASLSGWPSGWLSDCPTVWLFVPQVMSIFFGVLWNLASVDFSGSPEASAVLRGAAAPLRYVMDHDVPQLKALGLTTEPLAGVLAANIFGKDEGDGELRLSSADIEHILQYLQELINPQIGWGATFPLPTGFVMLNVVISDAHKLLLLSSSGTGFIAHCIDGLMLDMQIRADIEGNVRANAQRNYSEVFQQLALFEPGRVAILAEEKTVRPALEAVAAGSIWSEDVSQDAASSAVIDEAKKCAENALSLLWPPQGKDTKQKASPQQASTGQRHLMMSYQVRPSLSFTAASVRASLLTRSV